MITTQIVIILILLALNAFFALSELAVVSSSKHLLRQMARQGNLAAKAALGLAEDSGKFLSTVQVGITLVGTLAGAYGGAEIADRLGPMFNEVGWIKPYGNTLAITLVVIVITYLSVVFGELIPKQFALRNSESLAMFVAPPMKLLSMLASPVVVGLDASAKFFFYILRIPPINETVTEAEVQAVLAEGAASGAIEKTEHQMLQRIIRLGDRDLRSIMTHRLDVTYIYSDESMEVVLQKIRAQDHGRYPVIERSSDQVIGMVLAKELLEATLEHKTQILLKDFIRPAIMLLKTVGCLAALEHFKTSATHLVVVLDEYGGNVGIVTDSDILEAIVGTLPSNYGVDDEPLIVEREDGSWLVDGSTSIHEIHLAIGLEEISADDDFETIAGFLLQALEKAPQVSDVLERHGYRFEIVDLDNRRIDKILMTKIPPLEAPAPPTE